MAKTKTNKKKSGGSPASRSSKKEKPGKELKVDLSVKGIKEFIKYFESTPIAELTIGDKGKSITARKEVIPKAKKVVTLEKTVAEKADTQEDIYEDSKVIKSKFVGLFKPVKGVAIGKDIEEEQTVANIYSMNIDHEIKADENGTIEKILVEEDDLIEYGQPLFIIS